MSNTKHNINVSGSHKESTDSSDRMNTPSDYFKSWFETANKKPWFDIGSHISYRPM